VVVRPYPPPVVFTGGRWWVFVVGFSGGQTVHSTGGFSGVGGVGFSGGIPSPVEWVFTTGFSGGETLGFCGGFSNGGGGEFLRWFVTPTGSIGGVKNSGSRHLWSGAKSHSGGAESVPEWESLA